MARLFEDLRRTTPPEGLGAEVLDAYAQDHGDLGGRRSRSRHGALAAVLLVALAVTGLVLAARGAAGRAAAARADVPPPPPEVVDDPSVPLYTGLESFDGAGSGSGADGELAGAPPGVR